MFASILFSEHFETFCFVTYPQFLGFLAGLVCNMECCKCCTKTAKVILKLTKHRNAGIDGYCCNTIHTIGKPRENLIGISISTFQIPTPNTEKLFKMRQEQKHISKTLINIIIKFISIGKIVSQLYLFQLNHIY